jgi:hypothetical protein
MAEKKENPEKVLKDKVKELNAIITAAVDIIYNKHPNEEEFKHQKAIIVSANEALYEVKQELGYYEAAAAASTQCDKNAKSPRTNPECVEKSTR